MNKVPFILIIAIAIATTSFAQKQNKKFQIVEKLSGFIDSKLIYLDDMDSTLIINNQFHFTGSIKDNVKYVLLRTNNFSDYKFFLLENSAITFKAEKGRFKEAIIIGSKTQNEQNKLSVAIKITGNEKEQSIWFIRNHPNSIISANVLNVYGDADVGSPEHAVEMYRIIPNCGLAIIPGGHGKYIGEITTLSKDSRDTNFIVPMIEEFLDQT